MPYDYPGEYAAYFDGDPTVSITFERLSAADLFQGLKPTPTGTLTLHGVKGANARGAMLLEQWYRASGSASGPSKNVVIEVTRSDKSLERWQLVSAIPRNWVVEAAAAAGVPTPINVRSVNVIHLGLRRL
jgi:hypothetical protein